MKINKGMRNDGFRVLGDDITAEAQLRSWGFDPAWFAVGAYGRDAGSAACDEADRTAVCPAECDCDGRHCCRT
jgi:hypothetical protein